MKNNLILFGILITLWSVDTHGQTIDSLLQQAFENNPELKAVQLEYESAMQQGPQVSQLPDPTIGIGIPVLRPETRLGSQVLMVSASQMFPWFGTQKAKEAVVLTMAKSKYERIAAIRLELIYQIKNAYYNLILLEEQQNILSRNIRIFETIEKISFAKIESGKSIAYEAILVRIKLEELQKQIELLEQQKLIFQSKINEAINNSSNRTIQLLDQIEEPAVMLFDMNSIREKIDSFHPLLKQLDLKITASAMEVELNSKSGKPNVGVGLDYSLVNARTDAFPEDNGRDILIPKVMLSVPLSRKKYTAKDEEERLTQEALTYQKEHLTNKMISLIQEYQAEYKSALLMRELAETQIQFSKTAQEILLAEYSSKGSHFDELMKIQNDMLSYELEITKSTIQTHFLKIKVDRLTDY